MSFEKKANSTTVSAREAIATVLNTLEEQELDPIKELAIIAKNELTPLDMKVGVLKELASYVAPKRKSVDVNLSSDEGITVRILKINNPEAAAEQMFKNPPSKDKDS